MQARPDLSIEGQLFEHVVSREQVSIYRGHRCYLRIGPEAALRSEQETHSLLLQSGYPVPTLQGEGFHRDNFFYIETAVGETFGGLFDRQVQQHGTIPDDHFDALLDLVLAWTDTQVRNRQDANPFSDMRRLLRLDGLKRSLPTLNDMTDRAFDLSMRRLAAFPAVTTHGDFHAFNICEHAVIDFDSVCTGFAGYDAITAFMLPGMFPPADDEFSYSPQQIARALNDIDYIHLSHGLQRPSDFTRDFLMLKMMWLVAARKRPPMLLAWLDSRYEHMLVEYLQHQ